MTSGYPDWLRAFLLLGKYGANYLPVLLDPGGNLYAVFKGDKGAGVLANVAVDANGQLIMVPRGQSGVYMAVDADGNLSAAIKGEYEGALKTVKLDDQGRMYTYIADLPDMYGQTVNIGIAELAARLGWATTRDRRGQLVWHDSFESGRAMWEEDLAGTGAVVELSPLYFNGGAYSIKLLGGSEEGGSAQISTSRGLPPGQAKGLGLSFSFAGEPNYVNITFDIYDGSLYWESQLKYTVSTHLLELMVSGDQWQTITSAVELFLYPSVFHYVKLVLNHETGKFVRLLLNEYEFDLSAYAVGWHSSAQAANVTIRVFVVSAVGYNWGIYVDDVILTTQEP